MHGHFDIRQYRNQVDCENEVNKPFDRLRRRHRTLSVFCRGFCVEREGKKEMSMNTGNVLFYTRNLTG